MHRIEFVTLFPEMIHSSLGESIMGRAQDSGLVRFRSANPRDFCYDRHQKVDDTPYGGEPGMLIRAEPVALALESLGVTPSDGTAVIMTSPTGRTFTQADASALSKCPHVAFLCGHYEGIDHRVETRYATHVYSIGDYVLTNGELPALIMADAIVRLLPGVLGSADSLAADAHSDGLLSAPNFTRPEVWRGESIPAVLKSGDHAKARRWRRLYSLLLTQKQRPDLFAKAPLTSDDLKLLSQTQSDTQK